MKRPAFQFYPADWRKDAALQSCSMAAQGLWVNLMCVMHECEPYGHLSVNARPMKTEQIARLVGLSPKECAALLTELADAGVSGVADGLLMSRRMVRDERLRNVRADAGRLGGNPALLGGKVNQPDNQTSKQSPTPSSSSSSSPSGVRDKQPTVAPARPASEQPALTLVGDVKGPPDCPHLEVLALWAEVLPALPQHLPAQWKGTRADHLRARWRETAVEKAWADQSHGLAYLRKLFEWIGRSQFLTGRARPTGADKRAFVIELEWLVLPTNWAKVIEGKYHAETA